MLIRLISLVILFAIMSFPATINAEDSLFVYPKKKPSVFKKINKKILPIKKPSSKQKSIKMGQSFLLPKNKPINEEKKNIIKKPKNIKEKIKIIDEEKKLTKKIINNEFLFHKKNTKTNKYNLKE